ncbi:MAG: hypothetical protein OEZ39_15160 [Gammaproteobacteria bacterium]|nr:hypothetical protein [Gammaproteobacteria bacterium]MDH5653193.1 hypothetical protein [Gammaproteobacteria bacterium]
MNLPANTASSGLLFALLLTTGIPFARAACDNGTATERNQCLNALVAEMKQDMRTLIDKAKADKAASDKALTDSKAVNDKQTEVIKSQEATIAKQKTIIDAMDKDRDLANQQVSKLKLCCQINPNNLPLRFSVGAGATKSGDEYEGALLFTVGYQRLNVHGLLQDNNSGLIFGYQF